MKKLLVSLAVTLPFYVPVSAMADTIDPASYSSTLDVGASVTVRKTVTIEESVSTGVLDVMFLFDTSGSMGGAISSAKSAASDILTGLAGFGDLATGTGYYSDPGYQGVYRDLTTDTATGISYINDITLYLGGGGGDFPEKGFAGAKEAAENASWRPGSSRFIIALGDATFKESDGATSANTITALTDNGVTFIGIDFGSMTSPWSGVDPTVLADATGGDIISSSTSTKDIVNAIISGVTSSFAEYNEVTVSDLGDGLPGVGVSVTCVSADTGICDGDTAKGTYDRSTVRTFEFDVTFTGLAAGDHSFTTKALVDGGVVASEADRFTVGTPPAGVPEPATLMLFGIGMLGMGVARRRAA